MLEMMEAPLDSRLARLESERTFHDRQANDRHYLLRQKDLRFDDAVYLDHACWIRPAFAQLADVRGKQLLDLGCGHGMASVVFARQGAQVTACDLSSGYLREAHARARANGVAVRFAQVDAEQLPFADAAFDRIWGSAILHHLDLPRAAAELARVLRPGGIAVFCEPWGENRWLRWARRTVPYPGKQRTPDEDPLLCRHLAPLRDHFARVEITGYELFSMASRVFPSGRLIEALRRCDQLVLGHWRHLQRYCRYAVLTLRKAIADQCP
jgi:SAM-dependent methyltransferase